MTDNFLKAKHWHLFLLTFGLILIFQFLMIGTIISNIGSGHIPDPTFMFSFMNFFPLFMILFMGVLFGWFWSVVIGLQKIIPVEAQIKLKRFKIFFFIPIVYILFFLLFMVKITSGIADSSNTINPGLIGSIIAVIITLHLFSMFCIFHTLFFVAKTFKTAELQRKVDFSDFAGEFFLIWFFPIGVWIVQPKINKMMEK